EADGVTAARGWRDVCRWIFADVASRHTEPICQESRPDVFRLFHTPPPAGSLDYRTQRFAAQQRAADAPSAATAHREGGQQIA
ncbi:MAG: hypothetical protein ACREIA_18375, partial [Opitutaceae bacterium]